MINNKTQRVTGNACARVGLLGNPSDIYDGKVIALSIPNLSASVSIESSERIEIVPGPSDAASAATFADLATSLNEYGCYGGTRLLLAAIKQFVSFSNTWRSISSNDKRQTFSMSYKSTIPRQVGLAGSSAIIIAAIRALMKWWDVSIEKAQLAELALAAEVEDLGIIAGPQDRVIQSYEGLLLMDFKPPRTAASYIQLDPQMLPSLFIAWNPLPGKHSSRKHSDVMSLWLQGDPHVRQAIAVFSELVNRGVECLKRVDLEGFRELMDENFNTRASIWNLNKEDSKMVHIGRSCGAAVKFCGSGGSVVGAMQGESQFPQIEQAYLQAGYKIMKL